MSGREKECFFVLRKTFLEKVEMVMEEEEEVALGVVVMEVLKVCSWAF